MLTDAAIKSLKPKDKVYKVADRDGMYVRVMPSGAISFRLDYRLNGRRETVYLGKYGRDGISLARARELCLDARRAVREGQSPAIEKQREKRRLKEAKSFGEFGEKWLVNAPMADSTRAMRRSIFERELLPVWRNRLLTEITPDDLRAHCGKIVERGAPATAIHVRDILKQIYGFAVLHGEKVANPADDVGPASIANFMPRDRSLSPSEIRVMLKQIEHVATLPTIRLGLRLFLLTMVRKSELQDATWDEVDFENAVWTIPKERMKRSKAHNVYTRRYPQVAVDMVTEAAMVDVVGRGFDAGVRLQEFVPPDMIAVPITGPIRSIVVGSPGYFAERDPPKTPAELADHRCIRRRLGSGTIYRWEFEKRGEAIAIDVAGPLTLDEEDLMLKAALAGEGLAYLSDITTAEAIETGRLTPVLEDWSPEYPGLCLYYPSRRNIPARLRVFIDLIRQKAR